MWPAAAPAHVRRDSTQARVFVCEDVVRACDADTACVHVEAPQAVTQRPATQGLGDHSRTCERGFGSSALTRRTYPW